MQTALQVGAGTSQPSFPHACAGAVFSFIRASAAADTASGDTNSSVTRKDLIFIVRFLLRKRSHQQCENRHLLGATGAAFISGAKRSRRPADRSHGCFRVRAAIPATICIATPNNHQQPTITVQITGRSSSNTTTYTETNAAAVARNVPAATNTSTSSIFGPTRAFRMSNRDAREGAGGVSIPK